MSTKYTSLKHPYRACRLQFLLHKPLKAKSIAIYKSGIPPPASFSLQGLFSTYCQSTAGQIVLLPHTAVAQQVTGTAQLLFLPQQNWGMAYCHQLWCSAWRLQWDVDLTPGISTCFPQLRCMSCILTHLLPGIAEGYTMSSHRVTCSIKPTWC